MAALTVLASVPAVAQTASAPRGSTGPKLTLQQQSSGTARRTTTAARRRAQQRAAAAAAARALADAQKPQFKLDATGALVPDLRAAAAIIYSPSTGEVLWEENSQSERSIASITKVMTASVFLEDDPDLTRQVVVQPADVRRASTTYLRAGYRITTGDLLHLTLIASDNAAARALARVSPLGSTAFIERMNAKAEQLGLTTTHYTDPSGLFDDNVSSAYDMARLISYVSNDERMTTVMQKRTHTIAVNGRTITVNSTNALVREGEIDVLAGKTGFIRRAGYCLATILRLPEGGPEVAVVVLGAQSSVLRFWETRHLFNWFASRAQNLLGATPIGVPVEAASSQ